MVFLFSIAGAIGMTVMFEVFVNSYLFSTHFAGKTQSNLMIGIFTLTFLVCFIGLAAKSLNSAKKGPSNQGLKAIREKINNFPKEVVQKNIEEKKRQFPESTLKAMQPWGGTKTKENKTTTKEPQTELNIESQNKDKAIQEEKLKVSLLNFLNEALEGSRGDKAKMDNFNRFGVSLYLAGAYEILSQDKHFNFNDRSKILAETVQVLGIKKSHAATFSDKHEEYLMADARYMQMFQAGRNAVNLSSTEINSGTKLFDRAMIEWNKPKPKESQPGPVTVLFTDIAGSTALTQSLGDEDAQKVVRAHNRVVREALNIHAGKEIKHTGDGIMASFPKTSNAVEGAIHIQLETMKHNQVQPDLPLHLKIGLNTGEPLAEDDDLFGTVVQLSARIVEKATADKIYVSEIVRGICAGKNYKFKSLGGFSMKGFSYEVNLFEVLWK